MTEGRVSHTSTLLSSGNVLVCGGAYNARGCDLYNSSFGIFSPTGIPQVVVVVLLDVEKGT